MRAYVDMLRMEDKIYAHPIYAKVSCTWSNSAVLRGDDTSFATDCSSAALHWRALASILPKRGFLPLATTPEGARAVHSLSHLHAPSAEAPAGAAPSARHESQSTARLSTWPLHEVCPLFCSDASSLI
jgi:hypothetical protein